MNVAHWLTIPTARTRRLLEQIQFCLMPMTNPNGVYIGHCVTNAVGQVPKFGVNNLVEGCEAPKETEALWNYLVDMKPDVGINIHMHFTPEHFTRSIGMHDKASMPVALQKSRDDRTGDIQQLSRPTNPTADTLFIRLSAER
jgi:hypothetical protein